MLKLKSKVAIKVLNYFFLNPEARHYINELAKILDLDPKNVDRKLKELEKDGLLQSEFSGKQRYFFLAKKFPLLKQYREIFFKTFGLEQQLKRALEKVSGVEQAYLFGSYAKNKMDASSDIDLLAVGKHSSLVLQKEMNKIQKFSGREINIINLTKEELQKKSKEKNPFIKNIFSGKYIRLI